MDPLSAVATEQQAALRYPVLSCSCTSYTTLVCTTFPWGRKARLSSPGRRPVLRSEVSVRASQEGIARPRRGISEVVRRLRGGRHEAIPTHGTRRRGAA